MTFVEANDFPPHVPCTHDELKWGRKAEYIGGRKIIVCGRCRKEIETGLDDGPKVPNICGRVIETVCTKPKGHNGLCSHGHRTSQPLRRYMRNMREATRER